MKYNFDEHRLGWHMDDLILKSIEAKLDIILSLLQDATLTGDEDALLTETDEIIRHREYQTLERL